MSHNSRVWGNVAFVAKSSSTRHGTTWLYKLRMQAGQWHHHGDINGCNCQFYIAGARHADSDVIYSVESNRNKSFPVAALIEAA